MRSAAQIGEVAVLIEGNLAVLEFIDQLNLVLVTFLRKIFEGISLGHMRAFESLLAVREFHHLLLDSREIRISKLSVTKVNVIIESVFNSRSDAELDTRIKGFECLCHKVSR